MVAAIRALEFIDGGTGHCAPWLVGELLFLGKKGKLGDSPLVGRGTPYRYTSDLEGVWGSRLLEHLEEIPPSFSMWKTVLPPPALRVKAAAGLPGGAYPPEIQGREPNPDAPYLKGVSKNSEKPPRWSASPTLELARLRPACNHITNSSWRFVVTNIDNRKGPIRASCAPTADRPTAGDPTIEGPPRSQA